ncbi:MAG: TadE family type IV pilus minor pilin, partial [Sporichthyaceae bacterium]
WAVLVGAAQVRCADAAGVGARALARGEPAAVVRRVVTEVAPAGATVELGRSGDLVVVEVRVVVPVPGPWAGPGVAIGDRAVALAEDLVAASPEAVP